MGDAALIIDGKPVTEGNAWRFVKARRPHATGHREKCSGWPRTSYFIVSDRTGGAPWCHATGKTAGETWLKVARQMVEHDAKVAAQQHALEVTVAALAAAETIEALQATALRYAAERVRQASGMSTSSDDRRRVADALLEMANAFGNPPAPGGPR